MITMDEGKGRKAAAMKVRLEETAACSAKLRVIGVTSRGPDESVYLTIDGQVGLPIREQDVVVCHSSHYSLLLTRPPRMMFFDVLREKLKWGER
jgi:NAD kinase